MEYTSSEVEMGDIFKPRVTNETLKGLKILFLKEFKNDTRHSKYQKQTFSY